MKSLEKWQLVSFFSRGVAMGFGIIQSFLILRILSVAEWGVVQLAFSLGTSLGIYQHLGLASAANREIAASDKRNDIFKIFITSVSIRYLVTIPLSVGLYFLAPKISTAYGFPEILLPLRIYSGVLFLQGVQAILNSVISGTKRFKELFVFQGVIALLSFIIYVPFVYVYKVNGFFYAAFIHEFIKSAMLMWIGFVPYMKDIKLPTRKEFVAILKELFSLGMSIYLVKIIVVNWEKAGTNLLGFLGNAEILGIYSFALLYAKKLMHISDAVTDVSLPVFSEKYVNDVKEFKSMFTTNFNKIYAIVVFFAMSAVYWAKELIIILIGSNKYDSALPLLVPMVFAFIYFSLLDIIKSSIAIPAKLIREMILSFVLLLLVTVGVYFVSRNLIPHLQAMAYSMLIGTFFSFYALVFLLQRKLSFTFLNHNHLLIVIQALAISLVGTSQGLFVKIPAYAVFVGLYFWSVTLSKFIETAQVKNFVIKVYRKIVGK